MSSTGGLTFVWICLIIWIAGLGYNVIRAFTNDCYSGREDNAIIAVLIGVIGGLILIGITNDVPCYERTEVAKAQILKTPSLAVAVVNGKSYDIDNLSFYNKVTNGVNEVTLRTTYSFWESENSTTINK